MSVFDGFLPAIGTLVGSAFGMPQVGYAAGSALAYVSADDEPAAHAGDPYPDRSSYDQPSMDYNSAQTAERDYTREGDDLGGPLSGADMYPGEAADRAMYGSSGGPSVNVGGRDRDLLADGTRIAGALAPFATGAAGYAGQESFNETQKAIADNANVWNAQQAQLQRDWQERFNREQAEAGRAFSSSEAALSRDWSAAQNQKAMDFSERMSNTQWQRGVSDMMAAGINPMLAVMKGPSSSPTGVSGGGATASNTSASVSGGFPSAVVPQLGNSMAHAINSAESGSRVVQTIDKIQAEVDMLRQQVKTEYWRTEKEDISVDTQKYVNQKLVAEVAQIAKQGGLTDAQRDNLIIQTVLHKLDVPKSENEAAAQDTFWQRYVAPHLSSFRSLSSAAASLRFATGR